MNLRKVVKLSVLAGAAGAVFGSAPPGVRAGGPSKRREFSDNGPHRRGGVCPLVTDVVPSCNRTNYRTERETGAASIQYGDFLKKEDIESQKNVRSVLTNLDFFEDSPELKKNKFTHLMISLCNKLECLLENAESRGYNHDQPLQSFYFCQENKDLFLNFLDKMDQNPLLRVIEEFFKNNQLDGKEEEVIESFIQGLIKLKSNVDTTFDSCKAKLLDRSTDSECDYPTFFFIASRWIPDFFIEILNNYLSSIGLEEVNPKTGTSTQNTPTPQTGTSTESTPTPKTPSAENNSSGTNVQTENGGLALANGQALTDDIAIGLAILATVMATIQGGFLVRRALNTAGSSSQQDVEMQRVGDSQHGEDGSAQGTGMQGEVGSAPTRHTVEADRAQASEAFTGFPKTLISSHLSKQPVDSAAKALFHGLSFAMLVRHVVNGMLPSAAADDSGGSNSGEIVGVVALLICCGGPIMGIGATSAIKYFSTEDDAQKKMGRVADTLKNSQAVWYDRFKKRLGMHVGEEVWNSAINATNHELRNYLDKATEQFNQLPANQKKIVVDFLKQLESLFSSSPSTLNKGITALEEFKVLFNKEFKKRAGQSNPKFPEFFNKVLNEDIENLSTKLTELTGSACAIKSIEAAQLMVKTVTLGLGWASAAAQGSGVPFTLSFSMFAGGSAVLDWFGGNKDYESVAGVYAIVVYTLTQVANREISISSAPAVATLGGGPDGSDPSAAPGVAMLAAV